LKSLATPTVDPSADSHAVGFPDVLARDDSGIASAPFQADLQPFGERRWLCQGPCMAAWQRSGLNRATDSHPRPEEPTQPLSRERSGRLVELRGMRVAAGASALPPPA